MQDHLDRGMHAYAKIGGLTYSGPSSVQARRPLPVDIVLTFTHPGVAVRNGKTYDVRGRFRGITTANTDANGAKVEPTHVSASALKTSLSNSRRRHLHVRRQATKSTPAGSPG